MHGLGLDGYDADSQHDAAVAFHIQVQADEQVIPVHQHRKGQLILVLHGALTCEVENAMWVVPPHFALWVPGLMPHSNRATPGGHLSSRMRHRCLRTAVRSKSSRWCGSLS